MNARPEVLHFSGHGGHGLLAFENDSGTTTPVSGEALAETIGLFPSIKCVVLNSCFSDDIAKLVAPHVTGVVGCDASVSDEAANVFTRAFYRALAHGHAVAEAFKFGKADVNIEGMKAEADKYILTTR